MRGWTAVTALPVLVAAACGAPADGLRGQITVSGSSTVEPITSLVAEAFSDREPGIGISVDGPGTGDGFELFCDGDTDISDASRPIKDEEIESCAANGISYVELRVAIDGLAVLTGQRNDAVDCLDFPAMYALMGPESTNDEEWSDASSLATELGSAYADSFPDASLDITAPGEESGTYDTFVELVIEDLAGTRGEEAVTRPDYTSSANDNVIIDGIEGSGSSFGWVGYAFFVGYQDRLKAIEIDGGDGACVAPTEETIASGDYPLSRPLFIYVNDARADESEALRGFVDFYLSEVGLAAVAEAGYVPLTDEQWSVTQQAWRNR